MAFPDIPTGGRLLTNVQANTTATRTPPSPAALTKATGDLLIAIVVAYQTSTGTDAAFSGWTAGWNEFHDTATSTTMAIGAAYRWCDTTESSLSVTQAGTITGHAAMFLMSIPGAHSSTPPEAPSFMRANGTSSMSDTGPLSPSWGAEDTLWIAVCGNGETATGGSFVGISAGPGTYTGATTTGISADVVGGVEAGIAFLQENAASNDPGPFTADVSNARNATIMMAVRPAALALPTRRLLTAQATRPRGNINNARWY